MLDDYEHDIDTFNSKIEEKDELIETLKEQNELLKEKAESFNLEHKQLLEQQAIQNEVYIRDLKEQIKGLEQHLSEEKLTGDVKHKEIEEELARVKKEYTTKFDLKQQELNQLSNDLVLAKIASDKQTTELAEMKNKLA